MAGCKPSYLDNNYDDNQKKATPLPAEKIAKEGCFGVAEALSAGTTDFDYCAQAFASTIGADFIKSSGKFYLQRISKSVCFR